MEKGQEMKVFMATCTTVDPETGDTSVKILGVFSIRMLAEAAFDRIEKMIEPDGKTWWRHHSCFRGNHEVKELEIDAWYPLGID